MTDSARSSQPDEVSGDDGIISLRSILVGPEQRRLAALQARLDDEERRAEDISEVLPRVLVQHAQDPTFTRALTPSIEKAITQSVRRNPHPLADALFPVMGPAIRKAVSAGLAGMVESLNRTLELALSRRSIRWRIEAIRTGKSFAEVVLLKTLLYRVEQVFLIDRNTGLLLQHVQAHAHGVRDADMVSGMLTAIRDFAKDSFQVGEQEYLESLEVGDVHVWIEPGPYAFVAAVIRGSAPHDYHQVLEEAVETIHLQFGEALSSFSGDASALEGSRAILESCLQTQLREEERRGRSWGAPILLGAAAAAVLVWLAFNVRANVRWGRYLDALRAQPGIAVVSEERRGGRFVVSGLRDPLAADPSTLLAAAGLSTDDVVGDWTPYQALDPEIALARALEVLCPPAGVSLQLVDGVLTSSGVATPEWIAEARRMAPFVAGVRRFDAAAAARSALDAVTQALEGERVLFAKGGTRPTAGQNEALARMVEGVRRLSALAEASGVSLRVVVVGHADEDGAPESNLPLSRSRAELVRAALAPAAGGAIQLDADGVGSTQPAVQGLSEEDKQQNRRVTVRVTPQG